MPNGENHKPVSLLYFFIHDDYCDNSSIMTRCQNDVAPLHAETTSVVERKSNIAMSQCLLYCGSGLVTKDEMYSKPR